tara:strand:- start:128 stop:817 length:690 start_codon:yes stop_codon:yes gene_type:complete
MKACRICGKEKPLTEFYKRKDSPDGYRNDCKECCNKRNAITKREWKKRNGEKIEKECKWCKKIFETKLTRQEFCCRKCKDRYKDKNPTERRKKWIENYLVKTKERRKEYDKKKYLENEEKYKSYSKKYSKTKKGKEVARNNNNSRRIVIKNTDITSDWLLELKENTKLCTLCNREMNDIRYHPRQKTLDHMIPINVKGTHTKNNVRFICLSCNCSRPKDGSDILTLEEL